MTPDSRDPAPHDATMPVPSAGKMRVAIDAHVITGKYQGTRTTLTNLLKALAGRPTAHDILVYVEDVDAARAAIGPSAFTYRRIGSRGGAIGRLLWHLPRLLRRDRVDAAVFQYNAPLWGRAKRLVFIHDILPITHPGFFPLRNRIRIWLFFTISILRATRVIAVSEHGRQSVLRYYRLAETKMAKARNGPSFDPACYVLPRHPASPRYILTVGRIEKRKNIALLVEAFLRASVPDVRLIIVGSPDLGFDYSLPQGPHIENRRDVDDAALMGLYRGASLFVYPSAAEGFGIPLLDALLFGLPVISSDRTAMPEIARGLACLFDPTHGDAAARLAGLITGHFGTAPIPAPTVAQRSDLHRRFNWESAADDLLGIVDRLARTEP